VGGGACERHALDGRQRQRLGAAAPADDDGSRGSSGGAAGAASHLAFCCGAACHRRTCAANRPSTPLQRFVTPTVVDLLPWRPWWRWTSLKPGALAHSKNSPASLRCAAMRLSDEVNSHIAQNLLYNAVLQAQAEPGQVPPEGGEGARAFSSALQEEHPSRAPSNFSHAHAASASCHIHTRSALHDDRRSDVCSTSAPGLLTRVAARSERASARLTCGCTLPRAPACNLLKLPLCLPQWPAALEAAPFCRAAARDCRTSAQQPWDRSRQVPSQLSFVLHANADCGLLNAVCINSGCNIWEPLLCMRCLPLVVELSFARETEHRSSPRRLAKTDV